MDAGWAAVIATGVLVLITGYYAWTTHRTLGIMTRAHQDQYGARLDMVGRRLHADYGPDGTWAYFIVLENRGEATAHSVTATLECGGVILHGSLPDDPYDIQPGKADPYDEVRFDIPGDAADVRSQLKAVHVTYRDRFGPREQTFPL